MKVYRIRDWDVHFENNKSREREKCSFCCVPNKQDGLGYGLLMQEPDGESLYGAFVATVLVVSKQKRRKGYLTADGLPSGCPLSARQIAVKTKFKEATIQRMIDVVSSNEIGWIDEVEESARRVPAECPPSALEGKGREGKEGKGSSPPPEPFPEAKKPSWDEFWGYCQTQACLIPAEWYVRDKFEAAESSNWRDKQNWQAYARRCRAWWESDGRPMNPAGKFLGKKRVGWVK